MLVRTHNDYNSRSWTLYIYCNKKRKIYMSFLLYFWRSLQGSSWCLWVDLAQWAAENAIPEVTVLYLKVEKVFCRFDLFALTGDIVSLWYSLTTGCQNVTEIEKIIRSQIRRLLFVTNCKAYIAKYHGENELRKWFVLKIEKKFKKLKFIYLLWSS